jgi:TRAP-type C4-dicarboxylate transport system permease small subunit
MLGVLERLLRLAASTSGLVSAVSLMLLGLSITADVLSRSIWNQPIEVVPEATQFVLMILLVFLGLPLVIRDDENIAVSLVTDQASPRLQRELRWVSTILTATVLLLVAWAGYYEAIRFMSMGERGVVSGLPIWWSRFAIPAGCVLSASMLLVVIIGRNAMESEPTHRIGPRANMGGDADAMSNGVSQS